MRLGTAPRRSPSSTPGSRYFHEKMFATDIVSIAPSNSATPASPAARRAACSMRSMGSGISENGVSASVRWLTCPVPTRTGVRGSRAIFRW
ncbi:Uncharacterised protein [Mycobacteroides abscessus subsp. abscessus]|nr:Uncharacterised protein [Mycobacteroides abscessus subsp. abscessus]